MAKKENRIEVLNEVMDEVDSEIEEISATVSDEEYCALREDDMQVVLGEICRKSEANGGYITF